MPALWDSQAPALVKESILALRSKAESERQAVIDRIDRMYANQADAKAELIPYVSESDAPDRGEYRMRQRRLGIPNYAGQIARTLMAAVYGSPIEMSLEDKEQSTLNQALAKILTWNKWGQLQRKVGYGQVVRGDVWIAVQLIEEYGVRNLGLFTVHTCNVYPIYHPANPAYLIGAIERRELETETNAKTGAKKSLYLLWTRETFRAIDDDGVDVEFYGKRGEQKNPYDGTIPLVRIPGRQVDGQDYALSYIEDALDLQMMLINWMSELDQLTTSQTHSTLVTVGGSSDKKMAELKLGANAHIPLGPQGNAFYINPNAAHADLRANIDMVKSMLSDTNAVPLSAIQGGGQASSGYHAELQLAPTATVVTEIGDNAKSGLEDLLRVIVTVAAAHSIEGFRGLKAESVNPVVKITASLLPRDEETERVRHLSEVDAGLRTMEDYVRTWVLPKGADETQVTEYVAKLAEEAQSKQASLAAEFDAKFRPQSGEVIEGDQAATPDVSGTDDVAKLALNGAQVTALQGMLESIASGTLTPEAAIIAISEAFPTMDEARIKRMVQSQTKAKPAEGGSPNPPADNVPPEERQF